MTKWVPDVLGAGYEQLLIPLGEDPDGEGTIAATLVRYRPADGPAPTRGGVLYVHGFTDYFFQTHLAEHFAALGYGFYALDLRKCGRSRTEGQTPHFVTDLIRYDVELDAAFDLVRSDVDGSCNDVLAIAHSTGGLILALWLNRRNRGAGGTKAAGFTGLLLNSPWFDLHGAAYLRSVGTVAVDAVGRVQRKLPVRMPSLDTYGRSIHRSAGGEWDYNLEWKPLTGFPVTFGWLRAIRRGHAQLHRGLDIGVPSLVLRSTRSCPEPTATDPIDESDLVLDVQQIARWSGCLGDRNCTVPIEGARHDVFLSKAAVRAEAFAEVDSWLATLAGARA